MSAPALALLLLLAPPALADETDEAAATDGASEEIPTERPPLEPVVDDGVVRIEGAPEVPRPIPRPLAQYLEMRGAYLGSLAPVPPSFSSLRAAERRRSMGLVPRLWRRCPDVHRSPCLRCGSMGPWYGW